MLRLAVFLFGRLNPDFSVTIDSRINPQANCRKFDIIILIIVVFVKCKLIKNQHHYFILADHFLGRHQQISLLIKVLRSFKSLIYI